MKLLRRLRLRNTDFLTQIGTRAGFRNKLRENQHETAQSLLRGKRTVEEAVGEAFKRDARPNDRVRYTRVCLRRAGFRVIWDDGAQQPNHVSVELPDKWDDHVGEAFKSCFERSDQEKRNG